MDKRAVVIKLMRYLGIQQEQISPGHLNLPASKTLRFYKYKHGNLITFSTIWGWKYKGWTNPSPMVTSCITGFKLDPLWDILIKLLSQKAQVKKTYEIRALREQEIENAAENFVQEILNG